MLRSGDDDFFRKKAMRLRNSRLVSYWSTRGAQFVLVVFIFAYLTAGFYTELRLIERKPTSPPLLEDFIYYERALADARSGIGAYAVREIGPGYLYPPPSLFLIEAFQLIPQFPLKAAVFWALNVVLILLVVLGIAHKLGATPAHQGYWAALALAFAPLLELLHIGQINVITLFGIALVFLYQDRSAIVSGFGLALATLTKLSPLVLIVYLVACKQFKTILVGLGLIAVGLWLSALRYEASLPDYVETVRWLSGQFPLGENSHSFVSKLRALGMPLRTDPILAPIARLLINFHLTQPLLNVLPIMLVVGMSLLLRLRRGGANAPVFAVTVLGMALVPNVMWYHHYVFLLLPLLVWAGWQRFDWRILAWCSTGLLIIQLDRFLTHGLLTHLFGRATMILVLYHQARSIRQATL